MRQGETIELEIPGSAEYVSIVRQAVEGVARRMCFDPVQVQDIKLAVGEACTNAVKYGCPSDQAHNVQVKCVVREDGLMIEVCNNISGCARPHVPTQPDPLREGGFGLYLIRQLVDEVDMLWSKKKATVKMLKRLSNGAF